MLRTFFENHEAYAWALDVNERYDEAAAAIDEAKSIGIRDADMYVRAAQIDHARGDDAEARRELAIALQIDATVTDRAAELIAAIGTET